MGSYASVYVMVDDGAHVAGEARLLECEGVMVDQRHAQLVRIEVALPEAERDVVSKEQVLNDAR